MIGWALFRKGNFPAKILPSFFFSLAAPLHIACLCYIPILPPCSLLLHLTQLSKENFLSSFKTLNFDSFSLLILLLCHKPFLLLVLFPRHPPSHNPTLTQSSLHSTPLLPSPPGSLFLDFSSLFLLFVCCPRQSLLSLFSITLSPSPPHPHHGVQQEPRQGRQRQEEGRG